MVGQRVGRDRNCRAASLPCHSWNSFCLVFVDIDVQNTRQESAGISSSLGMNAGFFIAAYVSDVMQYPNQLPIYIGFALCFAAPHIEKRMVLENKKL